MAANKDDFDARAGSFQSISTWDARDSKQKPGSRPTKMSGNVTNVLLHASILTIPMLLFSALLLGLIFTTQVTHNPEGLDKFHIPEEIEHGAIYVNFSATRLILISSWSSSLGPLLAGSAVTLMSYPLAQYFLDSSRAGQISRLPTPYQLNLIIRTLSGGVLGALWQWTCYFVGWRKSRRPLTGPLIAIVSVLAVTIFLGLLVVLADTWLHVTTSSVDFTQIHAMSHVPNYSFQLEGNCTKGNNSLLSSQLGDSDICTLGVAADYYLPHASTAYSVLNNISSVATISTHESDIPYAYIAIPGSTELGATDYRASSYGLQTQCTAITNQCNLHNNNNSFRVVYDCNREFSGHVSDWNMPHFTNSSLVDLSPYYGVENPYYFGIAAHFPPGQQNVAGDSGGEIFQAAGGYIAFILSCNTTVYDVVYDSENRAITNFHATKSNVSVTNMIQVPMCWANFANNYLLQAANIATFNNEVQRIADSIALSYSKAALSFASQGLLPAPAIDAQHRETLLVTKIHTAPLFSLVTANLLFVVCGLMLFVMVLCVSGYETRDVQARLSTAGVVANAFEKRHGERPVSQIDQLFEENSGGTDDRVGIQRTRDGGYVFQILNQAQKNREFDANGMELRRLL